MQPNTKHWLLVLMIGVPALIFCGARVFYTAMDIVRPNSTLGIKVDPFSNEIIKVEEHCEAEKSGLKKGDLLVAVDGLKLSGLEMTKYMSRRDAGRLVMCTVQSAAEGRQIDMLIPAKALPRGGINLGFMVIGGILFPLIYIPIGLAVLLLRPRDRVARVFCLLFLSLSAVMGSDTLLWPPGLREFGIVCREMLVALMFPLFYYFFSTFPSPSPIERRVPWLKYLFFACGVFLGLSGIFWGLCYLHGVKLAKSLLDFVARERLLPRVTVFYFASCIILGLVSLVQNTLKAPTAAEKRRLRIIMWGALVSFVPITIFFLLLFLFMPGRSYPAKDWFIIIGIFVAFGALLIFPFSFAYAIIKHKVIPVSLIVRRGFQYALVSRAFIALEALVLMTILGFLWVGAGGFLSSLDPRFLFVVLPVGGIGVYTFLGKVNRRTMPIIDRRFFRSAYNAQQILTQVGQKTGSFIKLDDLFNFAALEIAKALHVEIVAVLLKSEAQRFQCFKFFQFDSHAQLISGNHANEDLWFELESPLIKRLTDRRYPINFDSGGRDYFLNSLMRNQPQEFTKFQMLRAHGNASSEHLLIPLLSKNEVIGFFSLSEKLSEQPFTKEDKDLLMGLASQVSVAIENSKLAEEIIRREQFQKEMDIAKEVQLQLFPQVQPVIPNLHYSGVCVPASGVGGDYFDFIELGIGNLGFALADVSGKGIGAALLMANLQACLRSHAPIYMENVTGLIKTVNKLTNRSTGGNKYATFFYGFYEPAARRLVYVNAGHNPPLLFRAAEVAPLSVGGTVIGLFDDRDYDEGCLQLAVGDTLIAYTDGITEAFSQDGEEFGVSRLIDLIGKNLDCTPEELQSVIMEEVSIFSHDTEQHDDMTLIIAKVV